VGVVPELYKVSRIAEGRSLQRAITASVLSRIQKTSAEKVLRGAWPRDDQAALLLKGPVTPTGTGNFPAHDVVGIFKSLAPGSAALKLFDVSVKLDLSGLTTIKVPGVAAQPNRPVFVAEGMPAPAVQFSTAGTVVGPARKVLVLSGVTEESEAATPDTLRQEFT
jgi:hypothetical protein